MDPSYDRKYIEVTATELPLHCPMKDEQKWNAHPRVYLPLVSIGEVRCPYCGTVYRLKEISEN